eukprot:4240971-Alexandrium_andersonii.AAC.1
MNTARALAASLPYAPGGQALGEQFAAFVTAAEYVEHSWRWKCNPACARASCEFPCPPAALGWR